ncbi:MAG TPA: methyltransferase domain-containing protein, partial [Elusimicrobiales bacterium]|nr:methyltransferase domain-containing protein [Elusimicrobiales bacterium]
MNRKATETLGDSAWHFHLMSAAFAVRDALRPRVKILQELEIKPGFRVLDYGCGPGSYIAVLSALAGAEGKVYALDKHPLAIKAVECIITRNNLPNVETIRSEEHTALPDNLLDRILFYDILHYPLKNMGEIFTELHRILKPDGLL